MVYAICGTNKSHHRHHQHQHQQQHKHLTNLYK